MDIRAWAEKALLDQDACNMYSVISTMREWLHEISDQGYDTRYCNTHPITVLYSAQVSRLSGVTWVDERVYERAAMKCRHMAAGIIRSAS